MKIAVFSDIHGNLEALKKVLGQIREKNADLTVFQGDIFQRGNEEFECLELLKDSGIICLKGNCELYAQYGVDVDPDVEHLRAYYDGVRDKGLFTGSKKEKIEARLAEIEEEIGKLK